jgi:predicted HTH domain antitoxin
MKTLTLSLPDNLELDPRQTVHFLAAKLCEAGKLSLGQAAELAGLSKVAFAEILADYDVSLFNYPAEEISRDADAI